MIEVNLEYLTSNHADLLETIRCNAKVEERKRIADLDAMNGPGLEAIILAAKADGRIPSQIAMECLTLTREQLRQSNQLGALKRDSAGVAGVPAGDAPSGRQESKKDKGVKILTKAQTSLNKRFQVTTNNGDKK
jgi:hypothetical protein